MKLPKMNKYLIALSLLFSFQLHAQVPDSLEVELPWQLVRLHSCDDIMGEGPKSNKETVAIFLDADIITEDASGNCILRQRTWSIIDWLGGETYSYTQIGEINFPESLDCGEDLIITYDQLPYVVKIEDVLVNPDETHEYSFNYSNTDEIEKVLDSSDETTYDFYIYDHTALRICKLNVYVTQCEGDIVFDFPETTEIIFDKEPYIILTQELLGIDIVYPCGSYSIDIRVDGNSRVFSNQVGKVVEANVTVAFGVENKIKKIVNVKVGGEKPDPIPMYIEEKSFVADEIIELEIWSEDFTGLIAWQFQLQFENAEVLDLVESEMFDEIPFNIFESESYIRALWTPLNASALDVEANATWFTLKIKPNIDGTTLDIFKTDQEPWSLIGIEDENYIFEYEAEFVFNIAPRNILSSEDIKLSTAIDVFPNPSSHSINITGMMDTGEAAKVEIFDMGGQLILSKKYSSPKSDILIDISGLPTGLFFLSIQNGKRSSTHKISKI